MTASATDQATPTVGDRWAVVVAMIIPSVVTLVYFVWLADGGSAWQQLAYGVGKTAQFALPVAWVAATQRARLGLGPLDTRGWGLGIAFGAAVVTAMMALYFGLLKHQDWFAAVGDQVLEKVRGFGAASVSGYAALAAFYALAHSGLEEYYWRWFVFGQLRRMQSVARAAVVSSLGFMAHHVILLVIYFGWSSPWTYLFSLAVAIGGFCWAWLYHRTQSIYAPWVSHLIVDAGIFLLGYDIVRPLLG